MELAEYLRAARAQTIPLWTDYLKQYSSSPHAAEARTGLATLITAEAETELGFYQKTVTEKSPNYERLSRSRSKLEESRRVLPTFAKAEAVAKELNQQIQLILDAAKIEMAVNSYFGIPFSRLRSKQPAGLEPLPCRDGHVYTLWAADSHYTALKKLLGILSESAAERHARIAQLAISCLPARPRARICPIGDLAAFTEQQDRSRSLPGGFERR